MSNKPPQSNRVMAQDGLSSENLRALTRAALVDTAAAESNTTRTSIATESTQPNKPVMPATKEVGKG